MVAQKAKEIYALIPDFGGFLVKANSEGEPGPGDYGRSHSQGANMLADAVEPYGGNIMWRAFVYNPSVLAALCRLLRSLLRLMVSSALM